MKSHLNSIYTTLYKSVATQWEHFSSFLDVDPNDVERIRKERGGDVYACFRQMLMVWLRQAPTKAKILRVLKELNFHEEANELAKML